MLRPCARALLIRYYWPRLITRRDTSEAISITRHHLLSDCLRTQELRPPPPPPPPPLADISHPCGPSLAEGRNSSVRVPHASQGIPSVCSNNMPVMPQLHMSNIPRHQSHLPLSQRNCVFSCAVLTGLALPQAHQESGFSFCIQSTFSEASLIKSGPVEGLSSTSIQQTGDLHGLPYKAS